MSNGLAFGHSNALGQRSMAHQVAGVIGTVLGMHFPADDLAAVKVHNQVQVKPATGPIRRWIGHVLAADLTRRGSHMGGRQALLVRDPVLGCHRQTAIKSAFIASSRSIRELIDQPTT